MSEHNATTSGTRAPGMTHVAELAGVSAQTVSRVLSGHPNVKAKTKTAVLAAVEQLGYRLNSAARTLSSGRSRTIGVVSLATINYSGALMSVELPLQLNFLVFAIPGAIAALAMLTYALNVRRPRERLEAAGAR